MGFGELHRRVVVRVHKFGPRVTEAPRSRWSPLSTPTPSGEVVMILRARPGARTGILCDGRSRRAGKRIWVGAKNRA